MRVLVISRDRYLKRKIELELGRDADVIYDGTDGADAVIFDVDSGENLPDFEGKTVKLSRDTTGKGIYLLPLPIGEIRRLVLEERTTPSLTVSESSRVAYLRGKSIKLTTHEYALLSLLIANGGSYITREEIAREVWGGASDTLINVYVHYLREKLETDGEKIILSSRKYGYKINEKYVAKGFAGNGEGERDAEAD